MASISTAQAGFWCDRHLSIQLTAPDGTTATHVLKQPFAVVGSHDNCDVIIDDKMIDAQSLLIWLTSDGLAAVVLSPRSKKAGQVFRIEAQHPIPLREWCISLEAISIDEVPAPLARERTIAEVAETHESAEFESVYCLTWKVPFGRQYLQLRSERPVLVGRKAPAQLVLDDDRLSGVHCCVFRSGDRLWIVDLGSTNGTWSGGKHRRVHEIVIDKSVCVGHQRLHFTRLFPDHQRQRIHDRLESLQQQAASARRLHLDSIDNATMQQAGLLASLRLAQERNEQQRHRLEEELYKQEQLVSSQHSRLSELEQQYERAVADQASLNELASTREADETSMRLELENLQEQVEVLERKRRELDAQLANRETDLMQREKELDRLAEEVAVQRCETEQLKEALEVERGILKNLELNLQREDALETGRAVLDDEHCVASPDFHAILDEALGALPRFDKGG